MFERELRDMSTIKRWGILRSIQTETDAEHCYYVMVYAQQICDFLLLDNDTQLEVLHYAMFHDLDEIFSGDIAGPWKRAAITDPHHAAKVGEDLLLERFPWIKAFRDPSPLALSIVKVADCVDELMWLANELQMGNKNVNGIWIGRTTYAERVVESMPTDAVPRIKQRQLFNAILTAAHDHMNGLSRYING